jgi:hypothetical protein
MRIGENGSLLEQPVEAGVVVGAEAGQVVVPELVDYNRQYQFWTLASACHGRNQDREKQGESEPASGFHKVAAMFQKNYANDSGFAEIIARTVRPGNRKLRYFPSCAAL